MKLKFTKTITFKLILTTLCIELLVVGLLGFNVVRLMHNSMSRQLEEHVQEIAPLLNASIAPLLFQRDLASLNEFIGQTLGAVTHGIQYMLVYDDLGELYIYKGAVDPEDVPLPAQSFQEICDNDQFHVEQELLLADEKIGRIQFGLSLRSVQQAEARLHTQALIAAAVSLVLLVLAMLAIGYLFMRQTGVFLLGVKALTAGDYSVQLDSSRNDELGLMAHHFNQLSSALRGRTEALTRSEQQYRNLAGQYMQAQQAANIGTWKLILPKGELYCSDQLKNLFGANEGELVDNYVAFLECVHADDRQAVKDSYDSAATEGGPFRISHRIVWPDGSTHWVVESGTVTQEEESGETWFLGIVQDITRQKLDEDIINDAYQKLSLEVELRKDSERNLTISEQIVASVSELMAFIDQEYVYRRVNQTYCRYHAIRPEDIEGHSIAELHGQEKFEQVIKPEIDRAFGGESAHYEDWFNYAGMGRRFVMVEYSPVRGEEGEVSGVVVAVRDITERKQAEMEVQTYRENLEQRVKERTAELTRAQQALEYIVEDINETNQALATVNEKLQELDQLKSMFIASMSHELRTPLNAIIGFSSLILNGMTGEINAEQRDQLERVYRSGKHLLSLITDVIDISKIESGKILPVPDDFPLREVIEEACDSLQLQIQDKGLELVRHCPAEPVILHSDRRRLLQCLLNFLSNAMKFTEQGSIEVSVVTDQQTVTIAVTDSGIGIKDEDQPRLFEAFVRLDSHLKTTTLGTGLGLYLTKKLVVEVLQGEVWAESTLGKGSTFFLKIPLKIGEKSIN